MFGVSPNHHRVIATRLHPADVIAHDEQDIRFCRPRSPTGCPPPAGWAVVCTMYTSAPRSGSALSAMLMICVSLFLFFSLDLFFWSLFRHRDIPGIALRFGGDSRAASGAGPRVHDRIISPPMSGNFSFVGNGLSPAYTRNHGTISSRLGV